jgi:hypothetical protein
MLCPGFTKTRCGLGDTAGRSLRTFQIHLYSPRSYATRGEAREDANKVIRDLNQWAKPVDIVTRELGDWEPMPEEQGKDHHDLARRKLGGWPRAGRANGAYGRGEAAVGLRKPLDAV